MDGSVRLDRRRLLGGAGALAGGAVLAGLPLGAPAVVAASRIRVTHGVQAGDVAGDRAVIRARADRPARMLVRWGTREDLSDARHAPPLHVSEAGDFTGKIELTGLPAGQRIVYEVRMLDLGDLRTLSEPVRGSFATPPTSDRTVRILWSGDLCGQGRGIDPDFGGYRIFRAMAALEPDLFVFSGDCIYADGPLVERVETEWGVWRNIVTPEKAKVAETLDGFRGNDRYNLLDGALRAFLAHTAVIVRRDDELRDNRYRDGVSGTTTGTRIKSAAVLAARAMQAFHEYMPTRITPEEPHRLFRSFRFGPHVGIFRIDMRSCRGPNTEGRETVPGPETAILGRRQLRWPMDAMARSDATWKIVAADMPLGLWVPDRQGGRTLVEAVAQGDPGAPAGRELEIADLLRFLAVRGVRNVVWITADVHDAAAHLHDPARAAFLDFLPFREFVAGPLNAGTFGPNELDGTFGPQVIFRKAPEPGRSNLPPLAGLQFFGELEVDGTTRALTARLRDLDGRVLFEQRLGPEAAPEAAPRRPETGKEARHHRRASGDGATARIGPPTLSWPRSRRARPRGRSGRRGWRNRPKPPAAPEGAQDGGPGGHAARPEVGGPAATHATRPGEREPPWRRKPRRDVH